jgi:Ca2+-binding RTX toxin-like protein
MFPQADAGPLEKIKTPREMVMSDIYGTSGDDTRTGGVGSDNIYGYEQGTDPDLETGNDVLSGGNGNDRIYGGGGNDTLYGGNLNDSLYGGKGDDHLYGDGDNDLLDGGEGNDTFWIGGNSTGIDTFVGGLGTDTVKLFENLVRSEIMLYTAAGVEVLDLAGFTLAGNAGDNAYDFSGLTSIVNQSGIIDLSSGNDSYIGHEGRDIVGGGQSNDNLKGLGGDDDLTGGAGNDWMEGGDGDDIFWIGDVDADTMWGGNDTDSVMLLNNTGRQFLTLAAENGIEILDTDGHRLSGTNANDVFDLAGVTTLKAGKAGIALLAGDDIYYGSSDADKVNGGDGVDYLQGNGGKDWLDGGAGSDTLVGGAGDDSFVFSSKIARGEYDFMYEFDARDDRILFDNKVFDEIGRDGKLKADAFIATASGKAKDREDRVIYDRDDGYLYYDADGSGKGKATLVALIPEDLKLNASDFLVI